MQNPFQKFLRPKQTADTFQQSLDQLLAETDAGKKYVGLNSLQENVTGHRALAGKKFAAKERALDYTKRSFWGISILGTLGGMALTPLLPLAAPFAILGGIGGLIGSLAFSTIELKTAKKDEADKKLGTLAQKISADIKDIREKTPLVVLLQSAFLPDMLKTRDGAALQKRLSASFNAQATQIETLQQDLAKKSAAPKP